VIQIEKFAPDLAADGANFSIITLEANREKRARAYRARSVAEAVYV
jgi:hypothetical protein